VVVEAEAALLGQEDDQRGRELLAHRAGLEHRAGRDRSVQLDAREPVALRAHEASLAHDPEGQARDPLALHFASHDGIDPGGIGFGGGDFRRSRERGREHAGEKDPHRAAR
jgi:hypothetical protein